MKGASLVINSDEIRKMAETVVWWFNPANSEARKQLKERNEALAMWLDVIEQKVQAKLKEAQAVAKV